MLLLSDTSKAKLHRQVLVALTVLLTTSGVGQIAQAQGQDVTAGSFSSAATLGPDQDSLLPPEVVPLDPAAASAMAQAQATSRQQADLSAASAMTASDNVPGLANNAAGANANNVPGLVNDSQGGQEYQSVKDFKKAAFEYAASQHAAANNPNNMWASGVAFNQQPQTQPPADQLSSQTMQPKVPHQSQTMSGAPTKRAPNFGIRRGGITSIISAAAGFGAGALTASYMFNPSNAWLGAGVYGMGLSRNAFRF
jgi:hypothetical protein